MRSRLAIPALVATLLAPVAVAPTPASSAPESPSRASADILGYIIYTHSQYSRRAGSASGYSGPGDLRVISPDGSGEAQLTIGPANDFEPAFSPDSFQVAFSSDRANRKAGITDLYVVKVDGSGLRRLTHGADTGAVAWSPDGSRLVVDDRKGLLVVPAAGGRAERGLKSPKNRVDHSPTWTADGTHFLFTRAVLQKGRVVSESIWSAAADGTDAHRLVGGKGKMLFSAQPTVSPDGNIIAWVVSTNRGSAIYMADLYFGTLGNVSKFVEVKGRWFEGPTFAPDGSALAVTRSYRSAARGSELLAYDLPGGEFSRILSVSRGTFSAPSWSN
ncbi:hypothetical protein [Sporichthya sp.]|uniref:hypothetical protein n=1 Tax=Sporichthya sp. TaxID=65475 RepID=UPI0025CECC47|nr:hypothetical protein [Sporichthya sp.]